MTRLAHLVRPAAQVADDVAAADDEAVHIELHETNSPVYVRNGQAMNREDVIDLILGADGVIVW